MTNRQILEPYLLDYLKKKEIPLKKSGQVTMVECPYCKKSPHTATIPPHCNFLVCLACNSGKKYIFDLASDLDGVTKEESEQIHYLKEYLGLNIVTKKDQDQIEEALQYYQENKFDMVPVAKNQKNPIESSWTEKNHKDPEEWRRWVKDGLNLGCKTGKISGVTVLDFDTEEIPQELLAILGDTFKVRTSKGTHYYYKYEELPKTRINDLKLDLENDGGQVLVYPSMVAGVQRKINKFTPILKMPQALLDYIKGKITVPLKSFSEKIKEEIASGDFTVNLLEEGQRNANLIKLGGILRSELSVQQTETVLQILNKHACSKPLAGSEIKSMCKSLSKYTKNDEQELAHRIMAYLRDVDEAGRNEIAMAIVETTRGEDKIRVDKALKYLSKERYVLKRGAKYKLLRKTEWATDLISEESNDLPYKVPYFDEIHNCEPGDLILIGARTKTGKSHLALNIIKRLVKQGITPYYVGLESGSRYKKIALQLGLKEGDFFYNKEWVDPMSLELEKNSIMIIDWLCPENFAEVDKIFLHFTEQLHKTNGVLIVFMQLKEDNSWFSCVSEDTECLTKEGWKKHFELVPGESIATWDNATEKISFEPLQQVNRYNVDMDLVHINTRYQSQLVTPNHNVYIKYKRQDNRKHHKWWDSSWFPEQAGDLSCHAGVRFPHAGFTHDKETIGCAFAELIGWILSEGSINKKRQNISISQSYKVNLPKCKRIEALLKTLKIDYSISKDKKQQTMDFYLRKSYFATKNWIYNEIFKWITYDKKPKWELLQLSVTELQALYSGLVLGDGHYFETKNNSCGFYQKDKKVIDWFLALCSLIGVRTSMYTTWSVNPTYPSKGCLIYNVMCTEKIWSGIDVRYYYNAVRQEHYKGIVWCPTVKNHAFISKKDDKVCITGNSNLVKQFPSMAVKFVYDDEKDRTYSKLLIDTMRESKVKTQIWEIPMKYDFNTKELTPLSELKEEQVKVEQQETIKGVDVSVEQTSN